jgi:hypothetical protein
MRFAGAPLQLHSSNFKRHFIGPNPAAQRFMGRGKPNPHPPARPISPCTTGIMPGCAGHPGSVRRNAAMAMRRSWPPHWRRDAGRRRRHRCAPARRRRSIRFREKMMTRRAGEAANRGNCAFSCARTKRLRQILRPRPNRCGLIETSGEIAKTGQSKSPPSIACAFFPDVNCEESPILAGPRVRPGVRRCSPGFAASWRSGRCSARQPRPSRR